MPIKKENTYQMLNDFPFIEHGIKASDCTPCTQKINDCPEMCLECNSQKECTKCNKLKNYYPIELKSQITPSQTLICITETIKKSKYPDFYFNTESESFKACYETCATCYGKGDQDFHNCENCTTGKYFILIMKRK